MCLARVRQSEWKLDVKNIGEAYPSPHPLHPMLNSSVYDSKAFVVSRISASIALVNNHSIESQAL